MHFFRRPRKLKRSSSFLHGTREESAFPWVMKKRPCCVLENVAVKLTFGSPVDTNALKC